MSIKITVLEPLENSKYVFALIGPSKIGQPKQGRISLRVRITNDDTTAAIKISKIHIAGQLVSNFATPLEVGPNTWVDFQNGNTQNAMSLVLNEPVPATVKVAVFLMGQATPVEQTVSIAPHTNDGGPLAFPGKANDLRRNEAWGASSQHGSGHQAFALDMGVWGWNKEQWSDKYPDVPDATKRESFRIYGMPVYAMAEGTVCWALNDHEERPTTVDTPTVSPSEGKFVGGGNQIFVKSGDEVSVYAHLQRGSIPVELLSPGASVKRGQYLGKVGLSGSTSHPHLHIHTKKAALPGAPSNGMNNCDAGWFRPMTFKDLQSLTMDEATSLANANNLVATHWTQLSNHSAPHSYALLYPSSGAFNFAATATDSKQYIGVWRAGSEIELRVNAPGWDAFAAKWEDLSNDSFRLARVETFVENNQRQFIGIFKRGSAAHFLWRAAGWDSFCAKWGELSKAGLRLIDITTYTEGATRFFIGVFRSGSDAHALWSVTGWDAFCAKWDESAKAGLRLVDLETHAAGTNQQYIGVFRAGNYGHALWSVTGWSAFTTKWDEFSKNGLRLVDLETFPVGNQRQFIGVFREGSGGHALESVTGYGRFFQSCERWNAQGLRLTDVHVQQ
jgi:hypothetical protein